MRSALTTYSKGAPFYNALPLLGSHGRKAGISENDPVPETRLLVRKLSRP